MAMKVSAWLMSALFLVSVTLSGCGDAVPVVTPQLDTQMISTFEAGETVLNCQMGCSITWSENLQKLGQLDQQQNWHDLAILVMQIGYESDLAYYYLGEAAQGYGANEAALKYYRISGAASTGSVLALKCGGMFKLCNGVVLPDALYPRMQAAQDAIANKQLQEEAADAPAPVIHHHHHHVTPPEATATATQAAPGWIDPPPVTH